MFLASPLENPGLGCLLCLAFLLVSPVAEAQLAPTPQKAPRTPVKKEELFSSAIKIPASGIVKGEAVVLSADRLKIGKLDMRLFGVVPPLLSASFGPQARHVIDTLAQSAVTCRLRDRDKESRLLASCQNEAGLDFGTELLRRGLAVTARGSLHSTNLAMAYISAEEAAKAQHLGLWSISPPEAAIQSSTPVKHPEVKPQEPPPLLQETAPAAPPTIVSLSGQAHVETQIPPLPETIEDVALSLAESADAPEEVVAFPPQQPMSVGFVEKYQFLLSSVLAFFTVLVGACAFLFSRWKEKQDNLRAVAAALRGELMSARAICLARISKMTEDKDEKATSWPRIRTLIFQAYICQIGRLGSDLARQIASIYGQASDYASYYVSADTRPETASKIQSLKTLVRHIEDVVPRLAEIEKRGERPWVPTVPTLPALIQRTQAPRTPIKPPEKRASLPEEASIAIKEEQGSLPAPEEAKEPFPAKRQERHRPHKPSPKSLAKKREPLVTPSQTAITKKFSQVKALASEQWAKIQTQTSASIEDIIPDYANLTEEEIEALSYAEDDDFFSHDVFDETRRTG